MAKAPEPRGVDPSETDPAQVAALDPTAPPEVVDEKGTVLLRLATDDWQVEAHVIHMETAPDEDGVVWLEPYTLDRNGIVVSKARAKQLKEIAGAAGVPLSEETL